ncbi:MCE family protein [Flavobacterium salilacus subsp. salilacus]|uniref:MlaD family protein n=1 Tax=Flavobacterium TaxID=237 RepID=UPI001075660E|nr:MULTISPECIES: MlaD family protein [Flavobacterium]KAF2519243.1 MCE family protein [Flavobacterium salilacus subsp. salilacus]MBE1613426.1 MCE family protein [Flavobacterium sp. SaA2.13]NDI98839.1 MCE family protein [Flavobacterium salilacus subsp. altitudinum]
MKVTREAKTAILVIGAILVFIWGYSFLKGRDLFNSYRTLYVIYENVEGLSPSAPITYSGLVIGKVSSIKPEKEGRLMVELKISNNDVFISKTSHAVLNKPDLVGGKQIAIESDFKNNTPAENGDYLIGTEESSMLSTVGQQLKPLQNKVETTVVSADSLMTKLNNVLDKETQANLRNSIADLSKTMKEFSQTTKSINTMLADNKTNINGTVENMNKASANLVQITDSLNAANLAETVRKLENTMANVDNILSDLESGKGTMGKLLKDEAMYNNLTDASKELKELLADFKNNPKRYVHFSVFGKKGTPYVEKE